MPESPLHDLDTVGAKVHLYVYGVIGCHRLSGPPLETAEHLHSMLEASDYAQPNYSITTTSVRRLDDIPRDENMLPIPARHELPLANQGGCVAVRFDHEVTFGGDGLGPQILYGLDGSSIGHGVRLLMTPEKSNRNVFDAGLKF